jgi:hypothetical protein
MTQYAKEYQVEDKPDVYVIAVGPHDPPLPEELTLGMGLVATAAQVQNLQSLPHITVPPWDH